MYKPTGTCFAETHLKDHLGNVRVTFGTDVIDYSINQINSYYPFGMGICSLSANLPSTLAKNEYLYNGKMFQDELGLNWLDYGARFYDPSGVRFSTIDPLAEEYYSLSPYVYCGNNPITFIDPDGQSMEAITSTFITPDGEIIEHRNDGDPKIYIVPNPTSWNGEKDGLDVYGFEKPGVSYETNIGNNIKDVGYLFLDPRKYPYDPAIEPDYTLEELFIPVFGFLKAVKFGKGIYKLIPKKISIAKQGKHILGHNNFIKGRSILKANPQKLLDKVHAKEIKSISKVGDNKVRVDFGEVIGKYVDQATGKAVPTTKGIIHMGKDGAHIVPAKP